MNLPGRVSRIVQLMVDILHTSEGRVQAFRWRNRKKSRTGAARGTRTRWTSGFRRRFRYI
jgi:hypothetical protein